MKNLRKKFKQSDFKPGFIEGLRKDYENLSALNERWKILMIKMIQSGMFSLKC